MSPAAAPQLHADPPLSALRLLAFSGHVHSEAPAPNAPTDGAPAVAAPAEVLEGNTGGARAAAAQRTLGALLRRHELASVVVFNALPWERTVVADSSVALR